MAFRKGENPNHPIKGASIKADPIRDYSLIQDIKRHLLKRERYRDYALFVMGVNTAWRAGELLSFRYEHLAGLKVGDILEHKQAKNAEYRKATINRAVHDALNLWFEVYRPARRDAPLFPSRYGTDALTVPTLSGYVKGWCDAVGAIGNFGSHTLRKSFGYQQRVKFNVPLSLLVKAYGHASEKQTLDYLGIQPSEISDLYKNEI